MHRSPSSLAAVLVASIALVATGCVARPNMPDPMASPSTSRASATPGVATLTRTPTTSPQVPAAPATLHPDGLARVVAVNGVVAWERVGGRGKAYGALPIRELLYLVRSARASDGSRWWLVPTGEFPLRLGWVSELAEDLSPALEPAVSTCLDPVVPHAAADLPKDGIVRLACFGSRPLAVSGGLTCTSGWAELSVQGAPWTDDQSWCDLDGVLRVAGEPVTSRVRPGGGEQPIGPVLVRGHFDDPGAEHCVSTSFGVSLGPNPGPGEPAAILACRQQFVVSELLKP